MLKRNFQGFTLIELLITISIIAILAALGLAVYNSVYKASRDAKRKADLKLIQSALEQYHADQHHYPFVVRSGQPLVFENKIYLTQVPKGPAFNEDYTYQPIGTNCTVSTPQNCNNYCLFTRLEGVPPPSDSGCIPAPPQNFGVTKP